MLTCNYTLQQLAQTLSQLEDVFRLHEFDTAQQQVREKRLDIERPELLVFVFGEGNFGKSCLINEIVGREVAPIFFLPKTWRVDLYKRASAGEQEYALLTTSGVAQPERLSIEDAKARCAEQEPEALQALKDEDLAVRGKIKAQITEVRWHLHNLQLPENIVLVDTPGFSQFRAGLNEARTEALNSTQGVAFDIQEVYENFFHRAHVVLWAFRADKLESNDTQEVFSQLSRRGKLTIGVLTYADKVLNGLPERKQKARDLYGKGVKDFIPVIVGDKQPQRGFGVPELREKLQTFSRIADQTRRTEIAFFCGQQADSGLQWLQAMGDTLIQNVSRIAFYCNATSDRLLKEAQERHVLLQCADKELVETQLLGLEAFLAGRLNDIRQQTKWDFGTPVEKQQQLTSSFHAALHDYLQLDALNNFMRSTLTNMAAFVQAQGELIASGYKMQQVVLQTAGEYTTRNLNTRILPPASTNLSMAIPAFRLAALEGGFLAGIWRLMGGGRQQELQQMDQQTRTGVSEIAVGIQKVVPDFVKQVAQAILTSADDAIADLYPGQKLASLARKAELIDQSIDVLTPMTSASQARRNSPHRYGTLFRIWSPRDDNRAAAIDLFCEWFAQEKDVLKEKANQWIGQAIAATPIDRVCLRECCREYIRMMRLAHSPIEVYLMHVASKNYSIDRILLDWKTQLLAQLHHQKLFDDTALQTNILQDFEFFYLTGLSDEFSGRLCQAFELGHRSYANQKQLQTRVPEVVGQLRNQMRQSLRPAIGGPLAVASAADVGAVYIFHAALWQSVAVSMPLLFSGSAVMLSGTWLKWRRACFRDTLNVMEQAVYSAIMDITHKAWNTSVQVLDESIAKQIVGSKTLLQKKPLDYAIEGQLLYS